MVRTRIAPSPTGDDLHIGNLYTALINRAFAKKHKGKFVIRIEDTDRERFVPGAEQKILNSLKSFGLIYDEGPDIGGDYAPYRQSERLTIYRKYSQELVENGYAYYCICTKERLKDLRDSQIKEKKQTKYDKFCLKDPDKVKARMEQGEPFVVRLNVQPDRVIKFTDVIRGEISISSNEVDDQVLVKSDGYPTYHLGVVVDDHLMEISHVIRAEEWISSTPKHILIYEAFGWDLPVFAHGPILRNTDRSKLSKRKNPVWAAWYLNEGYLPEAVINYLALMGWSHPEQKEIFSLAEFCEVFDLKDLNPVGPAFDLIKLRWMNQQYIQNKTDQELKKEIVKFFPAVEKLNAKILDGLIPLVKTRMSTLKDFEQLCAGFFNNPDIAYRDEKEKLIAGDLYYKLSVLTAWDRNTIFAVFKDILNSHNVKMPLLYYLLTGQERGLPLPESLEILGKDEVLDRLKRLID